MGACLLERRGTARADRHVGPRGGKVQRDGAADAAAAAGHQNAPAGEVECHAVSCRVVNRPMVAQRGTAPSPHLHRAVGRRGRAGAVARSPKWSFKACVKRMRGHAGGARAGPRGAPPSRAAAAPRAAAVARPVDVGQPRHDGHAEALPHQMATMASTEFSSMPSAPGAAWRSASSTRCPVQGWRSKRMKGQRRSISSGAPGIAKCGRVGTISTIGSLYSGVHTRLAGSGRGGCVTMAASSSPRSTRAGEVGRLAGKQRHLERGCLRLQHPQRVGEGAHQRRHQRAHHHGAGELVALGRACSILPARHQLLHRRHATPASGLSTTARPLRSNSGLAQLVFQRAHLLADGRGVSPTAWPAAAKLPSRAAARKVCRVRIEAMMGFPRMKDKECLSSASERLAFASAPPSLCSASARSAAAPSRAHHRGAVPLLPRRLAAPPSDDDRCDLLRAPWRRPAGDGPAASRRAHAVHAVGQPHHAGLRRAIDSGIRSSTPATRRPPCTWPMPGRG
jgi:hypothetical protein